MSMSLCSLLFIHAGNIKISYLKLKFALYKNAVCKITFAMLNQSVATRRTPHPAKLTQDQVSNYLFLKDCRSFANLFFVIKLLKNLTFMCCFAPPLPEALCS